MSFPQQTTDVVVAGQLGSGHIHRGLLSSQSGMKPLKITLITHGVNHVMVRCKKRRGVHDVYRFNAGDRLQITKEKMP